MKLFDQLVDKEAKLSLVGLGYIGIPIAVAFARKIAERSTGASRMPSMHPCSFSCANERPSPKSDVNTISTHNNPPPICAMSIPRAVSASAAPYTMMTSSA